MNYKQCCEIFGISDITFLPNAAMDIVLGDTQRRNAVYRQLLRVNDFEMGRDWFQEVYEAELSEGKRKGQHFTPGEIPVLLSSIVNLPKGSVHEPTAGTGGLVIGDWWRWCCSMLPWEYFPSERSYTLWELGDRSLPLLLINLSIRGIMAEVYHGDVLEKSCKAKYIVINQTDDAFGFSDVVKVDINAKIVEDHEI